MTLVRCNSQERRKEHVYMTPYIKRVTTNEALQKVFFEIYLGENYLYTRAVDFGSEGSTLVCF